MERALGLMCGAGALPARMAAEARRQGWRVIAFTFGDPVGLAPHVDRVVPSRITELAEVITTIAREQLSATLFSGTFSMVNVLSAAGRDGVSEAIWQQAGSLRDADLSKVIVSTLAGLGVDVLDQRDFLGDWLVREGALTARAPSADELDDVQRGLAIARRLGDAHVGQTVVLRRGLVAALEALEGTTAAIRRGAALAGPGAVVVKAVAGDHDYRFDAPAIGPDTIVAAGEGGVAAIAVEAGRVMLLEREAAIRSADEAGIALIAAVGL
jgi:DUF1009 family protein